MCFWLDHLNREKHSYSGTSLITSLTLSIRLVRAHNSEWNYSVRSSQNMKQCRLWLYIWWIRQELWSGIAEAWTFTSKSAMSSWLLWISVLSSITTRSITQLSLSCNRSQNTMLTSRMMMSLSLSSVMYSQSLTKWTRKCKRQTWGPWRV